MRRNWMPLYIPDFLADTMQLTAAETGAYLCLIMDYWMHDGLPDDDRKLAQIARLSLKAWLAMRATIAAFFSMTAGGISGSMPSSRKMIGISPNAAGRPDRRVEPWRQSIVRIASSKRPSKRAANVQAKHQANGQAKRSKRAPHYTRRSYYFFLYWCCAPRAKTLKKQ